MTKQEACKVIDDKAALITDVSDKIWGFAELSLMEYQSMALYCKVLREEGFTVEEGICGVPTAFAASYGSGHPIIGILGEYDALDSLSQEPLATVRKPANPGAPGHGCGHNCLGAGSMAAALAVKAYLEKSGKPGTVIFYGCPGEEGGAGKAFMARDGEFKKLDAAFCWHPGSVNEVTTGTTIASIQVEYRFTGISSHASAGPHLGRSALDAVELMNIGVQFLREHIPDYARVHYAITDAGGNSPNVVQPGAQVLYMIRSQTVGEALSLVDRVDKIAEAAAMMTETKLTRRFIDGTANTVPNTTLEKVLYENFALVGAPSYTPEEEAFAAEIVKTYESPQTALPGFGPNQDEEIAKFVKEKMKEGKPLNDFLLPYYSSRTAKRLGSTDVADVSWLTPTAQITAVTWPSNCPGHSWQNVSCGKSSIAHKGLLCAGKVMACASIDLYEHPEIIKQAKEEFESMTTEGYQCPIPPDALPIAVGEAMN